ncbi:MAG: hypothetical protein WD070_12595, partial [Pirellulaceae bacterium]
RPTRRCLTVARLTVWPTFFLLAVLLFFTGCTAETEDPQVLALRQQLSLAAEPESVATIADAKAAAAENPDVVFVGRIGAGEHEPFVPGQASFVVTEILPDEDGHGGKSHADNCPFCKRQAADAPRAAVQFVDASGKTLAIDARKLFGIQPGDTVVVRGKGEVLGELDMFQVTADGIYVRQAGGGP